MSIPQARERIQTLVTLLMNPRQKVSRAVLIDELRTIEGLMYRQAPVRRARTRPVLITAEIKRGVKAMARAHPDMHMQEIGMKFGINSGRVSEILNGKR